MSLGILYGVSEPLAVLSATSRSSRVVHVLQELVVSSVCRKLQRVLVVGEQRVVAVSQVSQRASLFKREMSDQVGSDLP